MCDLCVFPPQAVQTGGLEETAWSIHAHDLHLPGTMEDLANLELSSLYTMTSRRGTNQEVPAMYMCNQCGKTYRESRAVLDHACSIHLNKHRYKCEVCGLTFGYRQNYLKHKKVHV